MSDQWRKIRCIISIIAVLISFQCSGEGEKISSSEKQILLKSEGAKFDYRSRFFDVFSFDKRIYLETNKNCLIGGVDQLLVDEKSNRLFILDSEIGQQILAFDLQGNFICKIGRKGKGPKEYIWPILFALIPGKRIAVCSPHLFKVLIYDYDGNFIKYFPLRNDSLKFCIFPTSMTSSDHYLFFHVTHPSFHKDPTGTDHSIFLFDFDGNFIRGFHPFDKRLEKLGTSNLFNIEVADSSLLCTSLFDMKIYQYDFNGNLLKSFVFESQKGRKQLKRFKKPQLDEEDRREIIVNVERLAGVFFVKNKIITISGPGEKIGLRFVVFTLDGEVLADSPQLRFDASEALIAPVGLAKGKYSEGICIAGEAWGTTSEGIPLNPVISFYRLNL